MKVAASEVHDLFSKKLAVLKKPSGAAPSPLPEEDEDKTQELPILRRKEEKEVKSEIKPGTKPRAERPKKTGPFAQFFEDEKLEKAYAELDRAYADFKKSPADKDKQKKLQSSIRDIIKRAMNKAKSKPTGLQLPASVQQIADERFQEMLLRRRKEILGY